MRSWLISFITLIVAACFQASAIADIAPLKVVTSIKPLYSLVANIMQGTGKPELLLGSNQSPHHASLRPSERRLLAKADIIFWIGPELEGFLPRLLNEQNEKPESVSLIKTPGLILHPSRTPDHHKPQHNHQYAQTDVHIWLDTRNLELLASEIARQLANIDTVNTGLYEDNKKIFIDKIKTLRVELSAQLNETYGPFITYHDGYQYFEHEFGLSNAGFVSINPEQQPGARHIQNLRKIIREKSIHCIFYDAPITPPILTTLTTDNSIKAIALDPVGIYLPANEALLFQLISNIATSVHGCLTSDQ